jgi:membrane protein
MAEGFDNRRGSSFRPPADPSRRAPALLGGSAGLALLSIPALLGAFAAVAGLAGALGTHPATTRPVLDVISALAPPGLARSLRGPVEDAARKDLLAGALMAAGVIAMLGAGLVYLRTFRRVLSRLAPGNARSPRGGAAAAAGALAGSLLAAVLVSAVLLTGHAARVVADRIPVGDPGPVIWSLAKWPVLAGGFSLLFLLVSKGPAGGLGQETQPLLARGAAWMIALGGLAFYGVALGSIADNLGPGGVVAVTLLWAALFAVLYKAMPDRQPAGPRPAARGTAAALAIWLPASALLAAAVAGIGPLGDTLAIVVLGAGTALWLWGSSLGLLAGAVVRARVAKSRHIPEPAGVGAAEQAVAVVDADALRAGDGIRAAGDGRGTGARGAPLHANGNGNASTAGDHHPPAPGEPLAPLVARALADDAAYAPMMSVLSGDREGPGPLSDLECDLADWGFAFGVAWATERARDAEASDETVAQRALAAAEAVFDDYTSDAGWQRRGDDSGP